MSQPNHYYSGLLYTLAQEIRDQEGCVTECADALDAAAERLDTLTVTIRGMEIQRDELLAALEKLTDVLANIGITSGIYDDEQDALKEACDVIASVNKSK